MRRSAAALLLSLSTLVAPVAFVSYAPPALADYPKPSVYPISWQLAFEHGIPARVVVDVPGNPVPQAFWYMTYTATNNTKEELVFLPKIDIVNTDGSVSRVNRNIPVQAFNEIKRLTGRKFLEQEHQLGGELRLGEAQAKDGVAIWPETTPRLGTFSLFVEGLSGENTTVKGPDGKVVFLRKTLQIDFQVRGDEIRPGEDKVNQVGEDWIMR